VLVDTGSTIGVGFFFFDFGTEVGTDVGTEVDTVIQSSSQAAGQMNKLVQISDE
jgi:hypothetical protein